MRLRLHVHLCTETAFTHGIAISTFNTASPILHFSYFHQNQNLHLRQRDPDKTAHSQPGLLNTLYNNHNLSKLWGKPDQSAHSQRSTLGTADNISVTYAESNQTVSFIICKYYTQIQRKRTTSTIPQILIDSQYFQHLITFNELSLTYPQTHYRVTAFHWMQRYGDSNKSTHPKNQNNIS